MSWLPTRARLWLGAALCVLPLGLVWSASPGLFTLGYTLYGDCGYTDYDYCTPDVYVPGTYVPGQHLLGAQAPARVFLVFAAAVFAYAATRVRTEFTRRLTRTATGAVVIALALALGHQGTLTILCLVAALALVVPAVWNRPGKTGVFVPGRAPG